MQILRRLLPYFRAHYRSGILLGILLTASSGLTVVNPYFYKVLVDSGIYGQSPTTIVWMVVSISGSMVALELLFLSQTRITIRIREAVFVAMKASVYSRLMSLPPGYYAEQHKGRLLSRLISDINAIQLFFLDRIVYFVKNVLIGIFILAIMISIQWRMVLIASLFLPLLIAFYFIFRKHISVLSQAMQAKREKLAERWQEDLAAVNALQSFSSVKERMRETIGLLKGSESAKSRLELKYAEASSSTVLINLIGVMVIWGVGAFEVLEERISIGTLVSISFYLTYIINLFYSAYYTVMEVQGAVPSARRIFEILDAESAVKESKDAVSRDFAKSNLRFEHVAFKYTPDQVLLEDVNLSFNRGDIAGIVGASGEGKTTFVNLIQRVVDPLRGRINMDGIDLREIKLEDIRRTVAVIPQEDVLLDQSLRDNIIFYRRNISESRFIQACKQAKVDVIANQLPDGYETWIGERGARLSGGQRKRIAIARALLEDPYVLILDEATAMLDEETEQEILETITALAEDKIILFITHKTSNLKYANRVIRIGQGKVIPTPFKDDDVMFESL